MAFELKKHFRQVLAFPFLFYKEVVSPHLPNACLYTPSCSVYFKDSLLKYGLFKGFILGMTRIFRCNGWFFKGGDDPVPEVFSWKGITSNYQKFRTLKR